MVSKSWDGRISLYTVELFAFLFWFCAIFYNLVYSTLKSCEIAKGLIIIWSLILFFLYSFKDSDNSKLELLVLT